MSSETGLKSRDIAPDALRGFALLGILIVNIPYVALSSNGDAIHGVYLDGPANSTAGFLIFALLQGKFYLLFSFLFGYSSSYIMKGDKVNRARWIKRCLFLITLGVILSPRKSPKDLDSDNFWSICIHFVDYFRTFDARRSIPAGRRSECFVLL
jgi:uncharacterized membrane protein